MKVMTLNEVEIINVFRRTIFELGVRQEDTMYSSL